MTYDVAVVGTGAAPESPTVESWSMAYRHAEAYERNDETRLVAAADRHRERVDAFGDRFDLPADGRFTDAIELLDAIEPDVVSLTVPPEAHTELTVAAARRGVEAIHCEKPMAATWAGAQRMAGEAWRADAQLTFHRMRRFGRPFRAAKEILEGGEIGDLRRVEIGWDDFYDTGAHSIDLAGMFAGEPRAKWVLAQLDYRKEDVRFGMHQENQMLAHWEYDNGVQGLLSTGEPSDLVGAAFHLVGSDGEIRIDADDGPMLEVRRSESGTWETVDVDGETLHHAGTGDYEYANAYHQRAIDDVIEALGSDHESELRAHNGLNTAEIIFGGYESVRQRGRVDFPLEIEDNPFEAMVKAGEVGPASEK
ncbi:myo-inositol 2-dehydrogenase protein [Halorhabdus tiamatea SARL4B]|uniref:Glucose fructose oxidoreductase n=1 Tax=Halorhabdus tiamatea SARL4B TaxID=1033806 RepID=F7PI92_9EURY|nr:Gfo/Idh/MocA family oxidoreductase [Halorhabdus tiamatea]ERJ04594.1 myo-inositol 2-dehydrogenase protein [Halorhabdus tiamatea SARL4B]CCQ32159.1 glucose fructose oxidoreductase [Halorhabdus tiamatea SARL4B]